MVKKVKCSAALLVILSLCLMIPASALAAPVAENLELETYRGISVGGQLVAVTPDGGEVSYTITTAPSKGTVELGENGQFIYSPKESSRGRDYFGYRATDTEGQQSREATVIIKLCRQRKNLRYSDTAGLRCDYAAHVLAEKGAFTGSTLLGNALFEPERTMTKGEYLALCMACAGRKPLSGIESTGYEDDVSLSPWIKPYAATALFDGISAPSREYNEKALVYPAEAAELINRCFGFSTANIRIHENQSIANLRACGLWDSAFDREEPLTRSDAAILLVKAMEIKKQ